MAWAQKNFFFVQPFWIQAAHIDPVCIFWLVCVCAWENILKVNTYKVIRGDGKTLAAGLGDRDFGVVRFYMITW